VAPFPSVGAAIPSNPDAGPVIAAAGTGAWTFLRRPFSLSEHARATGWWKLEGPFELGLDSMLQGLIVS